VSEGGGELQLTEAGNVKLLQPILVVLV